MVKGQTAGDPPINNHLVTRTDPCPQGPTPTPRGHPCRNRLHPIVHQATRPAADPDRSLPGFRSKFLEQVLAAAGGDRGV